MRNPLIKFWDWTYQERQKLYMLGAFIVEAGGISQTIKTFSTQSAEDIAWYWIAALLFGEILHLRLAFSSEFWAWKVAHVLAIIIISTLLLGVILYG